MYPVYASAYHNRGNSYGQLGQYEQGIEDHNKAAELDPEYNHLHQNKDLTNQNE